jgi:hypothetical protein
MTNNTRAVLFASACLVARFRAELSGATAWR